MNVEQRVWGLPGRRQAYATKGNGRDTLYQRECRKGKEAFKARKRWLASRLQADNSGLIVLDT